MTDENLFQDSDCEIESVPVVDFDFIPADIVCESIPTPAPIFSCVAPVIVPEPPTDVGIDCPVFTTTSKIEIGYPGSPADSECAVDANPYATLQIIKTNVDPCDYEINLDINVPIPRPPCQTTLQGGTFNANVGYAECVPPGASIQINRVDVPGDCAVPDECQYTIDLDIGIPIPRIPCPEIRISNFTSTSGYENCVSGINRFDIIPVHREPNGCNDPGQCAFEFDLQIAVPIPEPPCPTISVTNFVTSSAFAGPVIAEDGDILETSCTQPNKFEISVTQTPATCDTPPQCDFGIALEIFVPIPRIPCPVISINSFSVQSGYEYCLVEPENKFTITPRHVPPVSCQDPGTCAFDLDLQIAVPIPDPPCPTILPGTLTVATGFAGEISYKDENDNDVIVATCTGSDNKLTVTSNRIPATCDTPAQCEFQLGLDIFVPVPRIPCPVIQTGQVSVISGYDICVPKIENKLEIIPRHFPPQNCDDPGTCAFDVNLQIGVPIPTPVCPIISVNTTTLNSGFATLVATENKDAEVCEGSDISLTITQELTPATCDTAPECSFSLDLEANVFIPRTPCPVLNVTGVIVRTGYLYEEDLGDDCKITENRLSIVPTHTEGLTCNDPGQCSFDVELEINVPIPKTPCPIINVQKFSVVSGFPQCITDKQNIFRITTAHREGENCDDPGQCNFDLELELAIPVPEPNCPNIYVNSVQTRSGFISAVPTFDKKPCQTGSTVTITKTEARDCNGAPRCDFAVDLELAVYVPRVPCPNLAVDTFKVTTAFEGCPTLQNGNVFRVEQRHRPGLTCDDPGFCEFGLTLEIAVPIPSPRCPVIYVKEFVVNTKIQSEGKACITEPNVFSITPKITPPVCPTQAPTCEFETTLRLNIPIPETPCPQISINKFSVRSSFVDGTCTGGESAFTIVPRELPGDCNTPKTCAFDLDLDIFVPIPRPKCPDIQVGKFSVTSSFAGQDCDVGTSRFTVEKTVIAEGDCNTPEECEFVLNLDIAVPIPPPKCPIINGGSSVTITPTDATEASGSGVLFVQSGAGCTGNQDSGSCNDAPNCMYSIGMALNLQIPRVCDPKLVVGSSTIAAGYDLPTFFVATSTSTARPECLMTLDMELSVNVPRPPCTEVVTIANLQILPRDASPYFYVNTASVLVPGEYCTHNIAFELGIPAAQLCPQFLAPILDVAWEYGNPDAPPTVEFQINQLFISLDCVYQPRFKLRIPKCKPTFSADPNGANGQFILLPHNQEPYLDFFISPGSEPCSYLWYIKGGVPGPVKLVKGETRAYWGECSQTEPEFTVNISEPDADGNQTLDIDLKIPKPYKYLGDRWDVFGSDDQIIGDAESRIEDGDDCSRYVRGTITLNTAECPDPAAAFTARPVANMQAAGPPAASIATETTILATVVKNLQLDQTTGAPVNPEFYNQMKNFFKQIQEDRNG